MGAITRPAPVKLVCGFIYASADAFRSARRAIEKRYGAADLESDEIPFTFTDHYTKEMGSGLMRRFCSFPRLIDPARLAAIKVWTNRIEEKLAKKKHRIVNIDPGTLDMAKLILASTKNFRHRIYIGHGIYAEVTLHWQDKGYKFEELTYPDYRTPEYIRVFTKIREIYAEQIRQKT